MLKSTVRLMPALFAGGYIRLIDTLDEDDLIHFVFAGFLYLLNRIK